MVIHRDREIAKSRSRAPGTTAKTALFGSLARAALVIATAAASTSTIFSLPARRASNAYPGAASLIFRGMSNTTLQGWTSHNGRVAPPCSGLIVNPVHADGEIGRVRVAGATIRRIPPYLNYRPWDRGEADGCEFRDRLQHGDAA